MGQFEISDTLDAESIRRLVRKEIVAIQVPNFYSAELSEKFAAAIAGDSDLEGYEIQSALKRLGMGYVDVGKDMEKSDKYHRDAMTSVRAIRDLVYPIITPLDHFRLSLEEVWPAGATIQQIDGKKCFVGTCRVVESGAEMLPHADRLDRMLIGEKTELTGQMAMNIYLQMAEKGGDVELWLIEPTVEQGKQLEIHDGLARETLSEPALTIRPCVGDLLLFNSELIHCVSPGVGGRRVTASCFVGYKGTEQALTYWS